MANGFGSLWVGTSGIQAASHGLNTTANNLSNVNTTGYVREQVVYETRSYNKYGTAAIGDNRAGLGVQVGTIVHARDIFLDKAYRTENGRYSFYSATSDAVQEVQTFLQESDGEAFQQAIGDFYEAFSEFAKDPSDTVNQNLILQKASLFLSRATAVNDGLCDYQSIINSKITEKVNRINEIGEQLVELNKRVQAIEANDVEQAMDIRDTRDLLLDELSGYVRISYSEDPIGIVHVDIEGTEFVDEVQFNKIGLETELRTGFVTPYWVHLSDFSNKEKPEYYPVFANEEIDGNRYLSNVSALQNSDLGELKALLMARGDGNASYLTIENMDADTYDRTVSNSVMMNSEAELDRLFHSLVTVINNNLSPIDSVETVYEKEINDAKELYKAKAGVDAAEYGDDFVFTYTEINEKTGEEETKTLDIDKNVCDVKNADVGEDGELPPRELFTRRSMDRYKTVEVTLTDKDGNTILGEDNEPVTMTVYLYNEEDDSDLDSCYTIKSVEINRDLIEQESLIPYKKNSDPAQIDYDLAKAMAKMWTDQNYSLNPSDTSPCSFTEFYTKWIGEIGTVGSIYESTSLSLENTTEQIEYNRQGKIGVSSDEELTNMIKYQQAYNASSRYINVVNEMIEHLLNAL